MTRKMIPQTRHHGGPGAPHNQFSLRHTSFKFKLSVKEENGKSWKKDMESSRAGGVPPRKQPKNGGADTRMTSGEAAPGVSCALAPYLGAHKCQGVAAYEKRRRLPT
jgi:hypothetical protein